MRGILRECCRIYTELPCTTTTVIGGDGIRRFHQRGAANLITISPRLHNGAHAAYICPDDVQLAIFDANQKQLHVQVQLDTVGDSNIALRYMLGNDCNHFSYRNRCVMLD